MYENVRLTKHSKSIVQSDQDHIFIQQIFSSVVENISGEPTTMEVNHYWKRILFVKVSMQFVQCLKVKSHIECWSLLLGDLTFGV